MEENAVHMCAKVEGCEVLVRGLKEERERKEDD